MATIQIAFFTSTIQSLRTQFIFGPWTRSSSSSQLTSESEWNSASVVIAPTVYPTSILSLFLPFFWTSACHFSAVKLEHQLYLLVVMATNREIQFIRLRPTVAVTEYSPLYLPLLPLHLTPLLYVLRVPPLPVLRSLLIDRAVPNSRQRRFPHHFHPATYRDTLTCDLHPHMFLQSQLNHTGSADEYISMMMDKRYTCRKLHVRQEPSNTMIHSLMSSHLVEPRLTLKYLDFLKRVCPRCDQFIIHHLPTTLVLVRCRPFLHHPLH